MNKQEYIRVMVKNIITGGDKRDIEDIVKLAYARWDGEADKKLQTLVSIEAAARNQTVEGVDIRDKMGYGQGRKMGD